MICFVSLGVLIAQRESPVTVKKRTMVRRRRRTMTMRNCQRLGMMKQRVLLKRYEILALSSAVVWIRWM